MPVPVLVAVTVTPGINAPDASETVPPTVALIDCPNPITESNKLTATDPEKVFIAIFRTSHLVLTVLGYSRLFLAQNTKKRDDCFGSRSEIIRNFRRSGARCAVGARRYSNQARFCGWAQSSPEELSRTLRAQIYNVVRAQQHSARYPPYAGSPHERARKHAIVPR